MPCGCPVGPPPPPCQGDPVRVNGRPPKGPSATARYRGIGDVVHRQRRSRHRLPLLAATRVSRRSVLLIRPYGFLRPLTRWTLPAKDIHRGLVGMHLWWRRTRNGTNAVGLWSSARCSWLIEHLSSVMRSTAGHSTECRRAHRATVTVKLWRSDCHERPSCHPTPAEPDGSAGTRRQAWRPHLRQRRHVEGGVHRPE